MIYLHNVLHLVHSRKEYGVKILACVELEKPHPEQAVATVKEENPEEHTKDAQEWGDCPRAHGRGLPKAETSLLLSEEGEQTTGNRGSLQGEANSGLEPAPSSS